MTIINGVKNDGWISFGKSENVAPAILAAHSTMAGIQFQAIEQTNGDELFSDPTDPSHAVMKEIEKFLDSKDKYKKYGLAHKRGILLYGPPGTGKTGIVALLSKMFMEKTGGFVIHNGTACTQFVPAVLEKLRSVNKDIPLMMVFDDIRQTTQSLLSVLDGQVQFDNVVYVFTTNYYNKLSAALKRPSRTDLHVYIKTISDISADNYCKAKFNDDSYPKIKETLVKMKINPNYAILKELLLLKNVYGFSIERACKRIAKIGLPEGSEPQNELVAALDGLTSHEAGQFEFSGTDNRSLTEVTADEVWPDVPLATSNGTPSTSEMKEFANSVLSSK